MSNLNQLSKEELKESQKSMRLKIQKEIRELDKQVYNLQSMQKKSCKKITNNYLKFLIYFKLKCVSYI